MDLFKRLEHKPRAAAKPPGKTKNIIKSEEERKEKTMKTAREFELTSLHAKMEIISKNNIMLSAKIRYNDEIIHINYYFDLPTYQGNEPIQVTDKLQIAEWYYLDNYQTVHDELTKIFEQIA